MTTCLLYDSECQGMIGWQEGRPCSKILMVPSCLVVLQARDPREDRSNLWIRDYMARFFDSFRMATFSDPVPEERDTRLVLVLDWVQDFKELPALSKDLERLCPLHPLILLLSNAPEDPEATKRVLSKVLGPWARESAVLVAYPKKTPDPRRLNFLCNLLYLWEPESETLGDRASTILLGLMILDEQGLPMGEPGPARNIILPGTLQEAKKPNKCLLQ